MTTMMQQALIIYGWWGSQSMTMRAQWNVGSCLEIESKLDNRFPLIEKKTLLSTS